MGTCVQQAGPRVSRCPRSEGVIVKKSCQAMLFILVFLGLGRIASAQAPSAAKTNTDKIDAHAVFAPSVTAMGHAREDCARLSQPQFGECFVNHMQAAGASPEAIAFMRRLQNDGYLRSFQVIGRVNIAYIFYPFRANENDACMFVNGTPALVDPDDYNLIPQDELTKNSTYKKLLKQHQKMLMFPGDRFGMKFIDVKHLSEGGLRFELPYELRDGCHACATVASVRMSFEFDGAGKFLGARIESVKTTRGP